MRRDEESLAGRYLEAIRGVVGSSAIPYGYTLTVWSSGAVLTHFYGLPSPPQVFEFFAGAILAFAVVGAAAYGGVRVPVVVTREAAALWGSFRFLSVGAAVGSAWFIGAHLPDFAGWSTGPFSATTAYFLVVGLESLAAG